MPVYLVVSVLKPTRTLGLFESWCDYVKGPAGHVELAFVNPGRPVYGFGVTYKSETALFGLREYDPEHQRADFTWYELPGVNEKKCEKYCASRVGRDRISLSLMTKSAMPFENEWIARALIPLVSGVAQTPEGYRPDPPPETAAFCSTTTIRALQAGTDKFGDVDPTKCTANDVVVLAVRRLGAVKLDAPPAEDGSNVRVDDVVRTDRWRV